MASSSPQRRAILERLGISFIARSPVGVEEIEQGDPAQVAVENALRKARAVGDVGRGESVLGVDTLVALGDRIYGKPPDERGARETLRSLAGTTHTVFSGLALITDGREQVVTASTEVRFRELNNELIDWYLAIEEWRGRAGGYAIQGMGSTLVLGIRGEYENVVGLPVAALLDMCPGLLWA